jgi:TolB-like protein/tRNA A-37 threonylcarbamoyl transferase component Bud32/Tfp pilus assembly protein PilF
MGVVFRAFDARLEREVALKFLPGKLAARERERERLLREARAAAALNHPNIATVYSIDEVEDELFIAMELVRGRDLKTLAVSGPLPVEQVIDIARQAMKGLEAAHQRGIVHRDVKSANLMLTDDGTLKIMDFGLAKISGAQTTTGVGTMIGTVAYASPEQARGQEVDARSDVWSLGVVLYELLTTQLPFRCETVASTVVSILRANPRPIRGLNPEVPQELEALVARALRKDPEERFASMAAMRQALDAGNSRHEATGELPVVEAPPRSSILVLPFENLSPDAENEYFCDGLAEDLISALTRIEALQVVARATAFSFKGERVDVRDLGRRLNVATVLEGSVRKAGNRLRITARLSNVADGYQLWAERFDKGMDDIFAVQDEISLTIAEKLELELLSSDRLNVVKRYTADVEAYNLYLKGRYYAYTRQGIECFEAAIARDVAYALAYAGLADSYSGLAVVGYLPPETAFTRAREAAVRAIELDDSLAEAHTALGLYRFWLSHDWPGAERDFRRAIEIDPNHAPARCWLANHQCFLGNFDVAMREIERARLLDPLSPMILALNCWVLYAARRLDEAVVLGQMAVEIDRVGLIPRYILALAYKEQQRFDAAIDLLEEAVRRSERRPFFLGMLGHMYALAGRAEAARDLIDELARRAPSEYVPALARAWIYLALGESEEALTWFENAIAEGHGPYHFFLGDAVYDPIRKTPRFRALLERVGLSRWTNRDSTRGDGSR